MIFWTNNNNKSEFKFHNFLIICTNNFELNSQIQLFICTWFYTKSNFHNFIMICRLNTNNVWESGPYTHILIAFH